MGVQETDPLSQLSLPPGFRFFPTDEELLVQYLCRKVAGHHFSLQIIAEIDLYKFDPWVLPSKAIFGEKEWYFFSPRDRKYPNGSRPNRVAGSGYWKATGTDKVILTQGRKVGIKKALVFYVGKAPKGTKTNWIMHEYRLSEPPRKTGTTRLDDWVLCRIYKKNSSGAAARPQGGGGTVVEQSRGSSSSSSSRFDDVMDTLPEIADSDRYFTMPRMNSSLKTNNNSGIQQEEQKVNLQNLGSGSFDWATLAGLTTLPELGPLGGGASQVPVLQGQGQMNNNSNNVGMPNDVYVPTFPRIDEEVQSGVRTNRVQNPGFFQQPSSNAYANQSFQESVDPFGIRYPIQTGNMAVGFRQ